MNALYLRCNHRNGELYRLIADSRGAFVQPALYEAFGLTVIEAMTSGLPTFATSNGGPAEIIEDKVSGFHIDPYHGAATADIIANFFQRYAVFMPGLVVFTPDTPSVGCCCSVSCCYMLCPLLHVRLACLACVIS